MLRIESAAYGGWDNNVRISNREVEAIVTGDVGPRIIRFAFKGQKNILAELPGQIGGRGEKKWMIRGGHRLWIAPEAKPRSYEPDNEPIRISVSAGRVIALQAPGPITGIQKRIELELDPDKNLLKLTHRLTNCGRKPFELSPWALTVMARRGTAIIPLPDKIPHFKRLTHNQQWSLWGYTDLGDPRWTFRPGYILFRQDPKRPPNKLGIAHREGWVAYHLGTTLFIKRFDRVENGCYPDGGVNFETFSNEEILELESLGPLTTLAPGRSVIHRETWSLHRNVPPCRTEADFARIAKLAAKC